MILKINDRVVLITFVGTIAALIANIFGYISKIIYPNTIIMPEIAAKTWVNASEIDTIIGIIFGNLSACIAGGLHALIFILVLDLTGWRYFWIKSLVITTTGWLISSIVLLRILNLEPHALDDIWASIMFYGAHLVYLSISSFLVQRYGVPQKAKREKNIRKQHFNRYLL